MISFLFVVSTECPQGTQLLSGVCSPCPANYYGTATRTCEPCNQQVSPAGSVNVDKCTCARKIKTTGFLSTLRQYFAFVFAKFVPRSTWCCLFPVSCCLLPTY